MRTAALLAVLLGAAAPVQVRATPRAAHVSSAGFGAKQLPLRARHRIRMRACAAHTLRRNACSRCSHATGLALGTLGFGAPLTRAQSWDRG